MEVEAGGRITKEESKDSGLPTLKTVCSYLYNFNLLLVLLVTLLLLAFFGNNVFI